MFVHRSSQTRKRRGQAIIEMALITTALLFLTLGLMQFALLANARITLTNLAREGARYAAMTKGATDRQIEDAVIAAAASTPLSDITRPEISVTPSPASARVPDGSVTVTVTYDLRKKLIPGVAFLGGSRWANTMATAVMVIQG